jgi:ABC-2 type transport system permease protein
MASLRVVQERGPWSGLGNLLWKELRDWWGTRTWWVQCLIWLVMLNGFVILVLNAPIPQVAERAPAANGPVAQAMASKDVAALTVFFLGAGYALSIGVVILAQDEVIGERRSGTAAWILSKPVSRSAFVLSKLLGNLPGIVATMVLLQGGVAYLQVSLYRGGPLPIVPFLAGLGLITLNLLFYLSLTLMLGTTANGRGLVVGLPLVLILGDTLFPRLLPWLTAVMPWPLPQMAAGLVTGQPIPVRAILPVIATAVWSVAFAGVALWRFGREEF